MRIRILFSAVQKQLEDQGWTLAVEDGHKRVFTKPDGSCVVVTDIVTHISYGKNAKILKHLEDVPEEEVLAITVVTLMEILQGRFASILKAADASELSTAMERFRASKVLVESYHLLEITETATRHFTTLTTGKKKSKMKRGDMLNACITLAHNAILVTRNVTDYEDVKGLRIENWAD